MNAINLLSHKEQRRSARSEVPRAAIVAVTALVVVGVLGYWRLVKRDLEQFRADIVATRSEIAENQRIVRLVEQYTRDKKQLQDRVTLIQQLAVAQRTPVRLLDGISQAVPADAWLGGISKLSGKLVVQGYATSHFAVAELMQALQRLTSVISNVELNFSERAPYEGKPVERFEILATLSG